MKEEYKKHVPGLDDCRKLGTDFNDSTFVWVFNHQKARKAYPATAEDDAYFELELRDIVESGEQAVESGKEVWTNRPPYYPAPLLDEILSALEGYHIPELVYQVDPPGWHCAAGNCTYRSTSAVKSAIKVYLANKEW